MLYNASFFLLETSDVVKCLHHSIEDSSDNENFRLLIWTHIIEVGYMIDVQIHLSILFHFVPIQRLYIMCKGPAEFGS